MRNQISMAVRSFAPAVLAAALLAGTVHWHAAFAADAPQAGAADDEEAARRAASLAAAQRLQAQKDAAAKAAAERAAAARAASAKAAAAQAAQAAAVPAHRRGRKSLRPSRCWGRRLLPPAGAAGP